MNIPNEKHAVIGSIAALQGFYGQANYAAAKAAVGGFTKSLAREVGSRNITVNAVAPGFIDTDMTKALPENVRQFDAIVLNNASGPWITPTAADMAKPALKKAQPF